MKAWFALIFSATLGVTGALTVLGVVALVAWRFALSFQTGKWTPLPASPTVVGVVGLIALAIAAIGVLGVLRQRAAIRAEKQRREDALRRVQDYRRDPLPAAETLDGRREPFISDRRAA